MMLQRRLSSQIMKCSKKRIKFDQSRLADIKEAITNTDVKALISEGAIKRTAKRGISRARLRMRAGQLRKGRHKGEGSRRGKKTARLSRKTSWINRIRLQRDLISKMKGSGLITKQAYNDLYRKSKGGFFRNKRHLKLYINEQKLIITK